MKIIIFAGGTGRRFWPVSRNKTPKQFQPVIENKPLIQVKYDYLRLGFKPKDIFVSTGLQYQKEVRQILKEIPQQNFIFEPEMRDTGPAVAFAIAYVAQNFPDEVISTQWSDHYVKKPKLFIHALKEAEKLVREQNKSVVVGVPPRFPSPHRGYIKFGRKIKSLDKGERLTLCEFVRFMEKPTLEVAKEYLRSGDYAWNTGYFVSTADKIMTKYERFAPSIYQTIQTIAQANFSQRSQQKFAALEKISFDYIFAENLEPDETLVINAEMGWNDVGEWIALKEALETTPDANVIMGNVIDLHSKDSLVYNYDDKRLIATVNLKEMVIVNTKDVVAIFHQEDTRKLKELLEALDKRGLNKYL